MHSHLIADGVAGVGNDWLDQLFGLVSHDRGIISLAIGAPEVESLPRDLILSAMEGALTQWGRSVFQYGATQGFLPLRRAVGPMLANRGIDVGIDRIHISTGSSGGLNSLGMALLNPGDVVVVERPSYAPALKLFRGYQARVVEVSGDEDGMLPKHLDAALAEHDAKFVYLLPTFQNPSGRTMPRERRAEIAEVLVHRRTLAIEDDLYSDLYFTGPPPHALWAEAPEHVVYLTSFSKTLAPALRTGVVVLPRELMGPVLTLKQGIDMQTSTLSQAVVADILARPELGFHLAGLRAEYQGKLAVLLEILTEPLRGRFHWREPGGGMFLWLEGPPGFDASVNLERALAHGVAYVPGQSFHALANQGLSTLRLSFASVSQARLAEGAQRLVQHLADV